MSAGVVSWSPVNAVFNTGASPTFAVSTAAATFKVGGSITLSHGVSLTVGGTIATAGDASVVLSAAVTGSGTANTVYLSGCVFDAANGARLSLPAGEGGVLYGPMSGHSLYVLLGSNKVVVWPVLSSQNGNLIVTGSSANAKLQINELSMTAPGSVLSVNGGVSVTVVHGVMAGGVIGAVSAPLSRVNLTAIDLLPGSFVLDGAFNLVGSTLGAGSATTIAVAPDVTIAGSSAFVGTGASSIQLTGPTTGQCKYFPAGNTLQLPVCALAICSGNGLGYRF